MLEVASTSEPVAVAVLSPGGISAAESEPARGNKNVEESESLAIVGSLFDKLSDDELIHVLSWLEMHDMISASHVSARWRQIALSTASLWQDVRLSHEHFAHIRRFATIASRAKELPIDVKILLRRSDTTGSSMPQRERAGILRVLNKHSDHITSIEFNFENLKNGDAIKLLASLPIFRDAEENVRQAGRYYRLSPWRCQSGCIHFPNLRTMRTVELGRGIFAIALRFPTVAEVRIVDFANVTTATLDQICTTFPGMTSLSITADKISYFDQDRALEHFVKRMSRIDKLSVTTKLFDTEAATVADVLRWPVRKIKLDVSASGNGLAGHVRKILRELLTSESVVAIRSTRQRDATGTWTPKYFVTVRVGSGAGRKFTFVHESFTRVLQNYIAPLLREKEVQEVVVDGHAACALFYAACNATDIAHVKVLRVVAGDLSSIRSPQRQLRLLGLKELILEKDPMRGSRVTAAIVEDLVSKLVTDERVSLRIQDVFVYADAGQHTIGQYVNLVEGVVHSPSWCHISDSTA